VQAEEVGLTCTPENFRSLIEKGMAIKKAVITSKEISHPFQKDLSFLYGTIFIGPPLQEGSHSRNVCIFADGQVDRCPTGTGVSGRLAIHYAKGEVNINQPIVVESIIGSRFKGKIVKTTTFGPYAAIIPQVEGTAHITGRHEFLINPTDPLRNGFILR
jgi:trans-L-3-hydroxyproline dehydratase